MSQFECNREDTGNASIFHRSFIHTLIITIFVFLIYSNTFTAPFELDDTGSIVDNAVIRNLRNFTDSSHFKNVEIHETLRPLLQTRYIGYLSFALNYAVHGLDVKGYHLVNILIHAANSLLLYLILRLTFQTPRILNAARNFSIESRSFIALFTALLFAVHPLQTQAVTYIVQRFASLAALFYLLSLVTYIRFRLATTGSRNARIHYAFYLVSIASAMIAMKTKEFALLLPIVIALYEFVFFEGGIKNRIMRLIPYALTMSIIPLSLVNTAAAKVSGAYGSISRGDYLLTQFRVIVTYLRLMILPVNQNLEYDYPVYRSLFIPEVLLSSLLLLSLFALGVWLYRKSRDHGREQCGWFLLVSCGIFWFFITAAPESSIMPIKDVIFEHRMYLPSIGLFLALTVTVDLLTSRRHAQKIAVAVMVIACSVLSATTYARNAVWGDSVRLLEDVVKKSPNSTRSYYNLGIAYSDQGRIDDAIRAYQTVIRLDPAFSTDVYNNLGVAFMAQGRVDEAIGAYLTALSINPLDADVHYNIANAYESQGRIDEAIVEYKASVQRRPGDAKGHYYLGAAYSKKGLNDDAINEYAMVLSLRPDDVATRNNLGNLYKKLGRMDEALNEYRTALRLKPDFAEAHYNLGNAYASLGRLDEARGEFRSVLALKPDFVPAQQQLERYSGK